MTNVEIVDHSIVNLVQHWGNDDMVVKSARVSYDKQDAEISDATRNGLIKALWRERHTSPFEHCGATFFFEVPIFVSREIVRHRTSSLSEISGRYTDMPRKVYIPREDRPMIQSGKAMDYTYTAAEGELARSTQALLTEASVRAMETYDMLLYMGVAKEVARMCMPVNAMTRLYMTSNLRNWLHFLNLRCDKAATEEIRDVANQVRDALKEKFPVVMEAWADTIE